MADQATHAADKVISFGPFRLFPTQQLLLENEKPLRLGSRAFDILLGLTERAGELVTKEELVAKVWPNTFVEESSLRVHMAALRRTLGDGQAGNRFIATIPGRGYRFVGELSFVEAQGPDQAVSLMERHTHNLPVLPTRIVGRSEYIESVKHKLCESRFITLLGPGGVGKTTLALAVAETMLALFPDQVCFVDFAPLSDAALVPSAVALAVGYSTRSDRPLEELIFFLAKKRILLVLDNCEHVADAAATLAEKIFESAPGVHILATSREPLRAAGEHVCRLAPLGLPPSSSEMTAADALRYPAIQLFVERAKAVVDDFELNDRNASIVADICRRLDGMPLAIEMAASRVNAFALPELATQLDNRFALLTRGRRTAVQRQQTLRATLDWSCSLLPQVEQSILNRIAVFPSSFSLNSASAVASNGIVAMSDVAPGIANLVEKSLIVADVNNTGLQYRLLDSTRAYALEKLIQAGEREEIARRHAECYCQLCERAEFEWETRPTIEWLAVYQSEIDNFRSALDWAFSSNGDTALGIRLTVAMIPLWLQLSLIEECRTRVEHALTISDETEQSAQRRMKLFIALGSALLFTHASASGPVWSAALKLAETLNDTEYRLRALRGLWAANQVAGDFNNSLVFAKTFYQVAASTTNASDLAVADRMLGSTLHALGDQDSAEKHIRRALEHYVARKYRSDIVRFHGDQHLLARIVLSRILWLKGLHDQAMREIVRNVEYAISINHIRSLCNVLALAAGPIAMNNGDFETAERYISMLMQNAEENTQPHLRAYGECLTGVMQIRRGSVDAGLHLCRSALRKLRAARSFRHLTSFLGVLALGACQAGEVEEGFAAIEEALQRCERYGERYNMAELLRIKGELIRRAGAPDGTAQAEDCFVQSLEWARRQGAISWELKTAMSLARLRCDQGKVDQARDLLTSAYMLFSEGFDTADLKATKELLKSMK